MHPDELRHIALASVRRLWAMRHRPGTASTDARPSLRHWLRQLRKTA